MSEKGKELIAQINIDTDELEKRIKNIAWKELFKAELEEIKAEIKPLRYGSDTYKHAIDDVFEILDNRISKLKGENNE